MDYLDLLFPESEAADQDVADVLNGVDLYLSTSTSEGFSLTTIQAMASRPALLLITGVPGLLKTSVVS